MTSLQADMTYAQSAAERPAPMRWFIVVALIVIGFFAPLICLLGGLVTLLVGDKEQGILLAGAGLVQLLLTLTLLASF